MPLKPLEAQEKVLFMMIWNVHIIWKILMLDMCQLGKKLLFLYEY